MEEINILQNIKVLYVEDEPITRNQVFRFLKNRIGKLVLAENGEDGIKNFIQHKPDIVITDVVMPDMSGIEMMRKIREQGYKCPFIITSALSDSKTILETVDLKIEKYLIKPIEVDALMETLKEVIVEGLEYSNDLLVVNDKVILTEDKKNEIELQIRNLYSKYLKRVTGKGAKQIQVLIRGKEIEILSKENLTTLEENFLLAGNYFKGIEVLRKTIYENTKKDIEKQIGNLINRNVVMKKMEICPKEKYERIILKITC
ncbi:Na-translocating system protein MpsC family protein [Crassaminicella profunda]|uniref:Na-translocating system protein MpsC family protein n=1 Tax=Crassaminicella profunda TaxID=1286698 RepID=UPI001CA6092A|nr:Na-translocating system protein MpsC family protein [Crassaminicella profunda]QZY54219.1 Na-translocating system protein MpsC family protein [Crassaminicella profunda]